MGRGGGGDFGVETDFKVEGLDFVDENRYGA